jgi:hypothetical protein
MKKELQAGPEYNVGTPPISGALPEILSLGVVEAPGKERISYAKPERVAVLVAHGMGQQIPFQTLDEIATRLREYDGTQLNEDDASRSHAEKGVSRAIKSEEQWLQRIELVLGKEKTPVHVYEAYWAPLTEGQITVKQVIDFLAGAGLNGLKHWNGKFCRWLFGHYDPFPIPLRTVLFLLVALATVTSLVIMNAAIALVAANRALLGSKAEWFTDNLFEDLTTTFDVVLTAMFVFAVLLIAAKFTRRVKWKLVRWTRATLSILSLVGAVFVVVVAGLAIPFLFYGHIRGAPAVDRLWYKFASASVVDGFGNRFDAGTWWLLWIVALVLLVVWTERVGAGFLHDITKGRAKMFTLACTLAVAALVALLGWVIYRFNAIFVEAAGKDVTEGFRHALAWPLLVVASAFIRLVLVQFIGDVAIYIMPYKLDAFNDLRKEIKALVYNTAHAIYSLRSDPEGPFEYSRIVLVGHSLGSVIVYDALNRLILEDYAAPEPLAVTERTPMLLTFGSPLDKTAYLFAVQGRGTSEARESVAAAVQPMIQSYESRPARWTNIFSRWDFISGNLQFYDYPMANNEGEAKRMRDDEEPKRVDNKADPDATTLLMAHTEYWNNDAVIGELYVAVTALSATS